MAILSHLCDIARRYQLAFGLLLPPVIVGRGMARSASLLLVMQTFTRISFCYSSVAWPALMRFQSQSLL
jgi:hypothetical protein